MRLLLLAGLALVLWSGALAADPATGPDGAVDWQRAQKLHQRAQAGEKLSAEDQAYYDRARALRQRQAALTPTASFDLPPLTDSDGEYKGLALGLYGDGQNTPPAAHQQAAIATAARVVSLDAEGKPSQDGKVVLMSVGMSNTTQEFSNFVRLANGDSRKSDRVVIVDAAQGGRAADSWTSFERTDTWQVALQRLALHDVTPQQVQVLWVKQARIAPAQLGAFPDHAQALKADLKQIVARSQERLPNLKLVYFSSRTYGGWATGQLNPEPYAYESAFSVQWLIRDQVAAQDPDLAYDRCPVLLWGPYLWTDGKKGRGDGMTWLQTDTAADGTHPSAAGQTKVAKALLDFFTTDATAMPWFLGGR